MGAFGVNAFSTVFSTVFIACLAPFGARTRVNHLVAYRSYVSKRLKESLFFYILEKVG